ncbi:MAG: nuclear transport factor 2 family protein [Acidobacteriota bacterium]|nr:nuclear transport factor 2 family protein [Acidobacteriota bacterium]
MLRPLPKRFFSFVVLALLVCVLPAVAMPRQVRRDYKQQVEALEEQWRAASLANDVNGMARLLSDDYIGISLSGNIYTKAQQLERMRTRKMVLTRIQVDELKVKLIGSIAIVTSRADFEGSNDGLPVSGTFRYTRVYKLLPNGEWKITTFEATRLPPKHAELDAMAPLPQPVH